MVALERWELLGRGLSGSDGPVSDAESSIKGSCLAFEMPKVEGRGSGCLMLSYSLKKESNDI
jgi:hypothetical protein